MPLVDRLFLAAMLLAMPAAGLGQDAAEAFEPLAIARCSPGEAAIATQGFIRLGGAEQWVTIRGADCGNPVVLFLHGGPGNPMSPYSAAIFADWERDFTIVQWDQRGAGRTYGRNPALSEADLSVGRMAEDGIELAAQLAAALDQPRIILVGSSWGSVLGVHMARARPDLFHAYVGVSQLVAYRENQEASYRAVLALAGAAGDAETVARLDALGPPPWTDPRAFGILRRATRAYEARSAVRAPLYATPEAAADDEAGEEYSYLQFVGLAGDGMFAGVDLPSLGHRFGIPVYVVHGAEDLVTVPEVARRYFESIEAPDKRFILLPDTGHDPNRAIMSAVLDLLKERARHW